MVLQISLKGKAVLVTGCDTGFGHALALQLADLVQYLNTIIFMLNETPPELILQIE
jgi:NAD(P)-dependent dehydrogenase (short-subunit alcohol dehydrogenase family)